MFVIDTRMKPWQGSTSSKAGGARGENGLKGAEPAKLGVVAPLPSSSSSSDPSSEMGALRWQDSVSAGFNWGLRVL